MSTAVQQREAQLWAAQRCAEQLFDDVRGRGLIRPGVLESELSDEIHALARAAFGLRRHWHRRIVRSGPNTLLTYSEDGEDRRLMDDDIVYLDFGPVFGDWEADLGRSYVLGPDPRKHALIEDIHEAFRLGQALYEATPDLTAGGLYDFVVRCATDRGWSFGAPTAGHPVDAFPHASGPARRYSIRSGNDVSLREPLENGQPRHWILEIHFVDRVLGYGAFMEELLTIRGDR